MLPAIHRDLHLDEAAVGAISSLPLVLLAAAAISGSLLVARIGARRALIGGLCVVAVASAARGLGPSTAVLFLMTFLMGIGVAVCQPTLPSLVRQWFPDRTGIATAVYSNGFLIGEIVAASLTVPLILPLVRGRWELDFVVWAIPVVVTTLAVFLLTAHEPREASAEPMRWWPDWRSGGTWRLGVVLGCASSAYFGSNAFLPDYLKATHHGALIAPALTSLNVGQFPASVITAVIAGRVIARRWPLAIAGLLSLIAVIGYAMGGGWIVAWAGLMGFSTAWVFVLSLALPPLLATPDDVHRLSAAMFTISYALPFVASLIGGALWDASGVPYSGFLPIGVAAAVMLALVGSLDLRGSWAGEKPADETGSPLQAGM